MSEAKITPELVKQARELLKREHSERVRLEKVAASSELEKRASKIAFREIELGASEPFKSFKEYQEKIASLMQEDLDVVEKALDRGYGISGRSGDLAEGNPSVKGMNAFERVICTGELAE